MSQIDSRFDPIETQNKTQAAKKNSEDRTLSGRP